MRTTPKIKRVQLKLDHVRDSAVIGIVSPEPDYKLSLALNKKLNISLKSVHPVEVPEEPGQNIAFSRFSDSEGSHSFIFDLISNRHGKYFLLKKLRNIDYILKIYNPDNETDPGKIIPILRSTDCVTAVFNIDTDSLKDKNLQYIMH